MLIKKNESLELVAKTNKLQTANEEIVELMSL